MKEKFYKKLWMVIMFSGLAQLFGLGATASDKVFTRAVDLSGNTFSFSLPENFSKDMPAADMVERLDVSDLKKFDNPEYGNIIRRWWDFKRSGFFGKALGTVMMDISVQRLPENKKKLLGDSSYNIYDRLDFMAAIYDLLHQRYDQLNLETESDEPGVKAYYFSFCILLGERITSSFRDLVYDEKKWLGYSVAAPLNQLIVGRVLPLTDQTFIEVVFTFSPNQGILPMEFIRVAEKTTHIIEHSLKVDYAEKNDVRLLVERDWLEQTHDDVLAENYDKVLVPLFGPNIREELIENRRMLLEFDKEMGLQDE